MKKGTKKKIRRGLDQYGWFMFYPDKWMGDLDLMRCSLEAQGLWMQMCCLMFKESVPRGVLRNDVAELAERLRLPCDKVRELVSELGKKNVFSRGAVLHEEYAGAPWLASVGKKDIVCRYMFEQWRLKMQRAEAGSIGGRISRPKKDDPSKREANGSKPTQGNLLGDGGLQRNDASKQETTLSKESRSNKGKDLDPQTKTKSKGKIARGGQLDSAGSRALAAVAALSAASGKTPEAFRAELLERVSSVSALVKPLDGAHVAWWSDALGVLPVQGLCDFAVQVSHAEESCSGRGSALRDPGAFLADRLLAVARAGKWVVASPPGGSK